MSNKRSDDNYQYRGVKRRDFRNEKAGPEAIPKVNKKDVKKWCKGKVGKIHDFKPRRYSTLTTDFFHGKLVIVFKCTVCGRENTESYEKWPVGMIFPGLWADKYWNGEE